MDWNDWVRENTDPSAASDKPEALAGLRVLDLSYGSFAGLFASSLLSESGARVIRVEPLEGDLARRMTPFGRRIEGTGLPYLVEGRNKEYITLNLKKSKGKDLLKELVKGTDILLETGFPGIMDEGGTGWNALKEVNPRLIYVAITSYGQVGELSAVARVARWRCYDSVAQALSGVVSTTGMPDDTDGQPKHKGVPTMAGNWMGWYAGGAFAALAAMAALFAREVTGTGQFIDISPAEALMNFNNYALQFFHLTGVTLGRTANMDPGAHPYCYVRCKDGMIFLNGYTDEDWRALCGLIGREDLARRYPGIADRTQHQNAVSIVREIEEFTLERTRVELMALWRSSAGEMTGAVAQEVLTPGEASGLDHWHERQALVQVEEAPWGKFLMQGIPVKMSETPPRMKWVCRKTGADNDSVYGELLGLDGDAMDALREEGII